MTYQHVGTIASAAKLVQTPATLNLIALSDQRADVGNYSGKSVGPRAGLLKSQSPSYLPWTCASASHFAFASTLASSGLTPASRCSTKTRLGA